MPLCDAFARVLTAGRPQFNHRVVEAKHRYPSFDTAAFGAFLTTAVNTVVDSVASAHPERVASVVVATYDLALELVGQSLTAISARGAVVERTWNTLAPRYASLIAERPFETLGALTNASLYLARLPDVRFDEWLLEMNRLAPHAVTRAHLRALGQVVAWRAGVAHFRAGALEAADTLGDAMAIDAFGAKADDSWPHLRDRLKADPWWSPDPKRAQVRDQGIEVGRFSGFGGTFSEPPQVRATDDGFIVKSGSRYSLLVADAYGAVLHAATAEEYADLPASTGCPAAPTLTFPQAAVALACNRHTLAVTSPFTHTIRLFPRT